MLILTSSNMGYFVVLISSIIYCTNSVGRISVLKHGQRQVQLPEGPIRGLEVILDSDHAKLNKVEVFRGIQYHTTRGKTLRFFLPRIPLDSWSIRRSMSTFSKACSQSKVHIKEAIKMSKEMLNRWRRLAHFTDRTDEDCLYLNIFVPSSEKNETSLYPVMVFVHGDSYDIGTGNAYDGSVLASFGNVIVVTVNYRLGVLGFLSTGDRNANGNQALLDLLAVITWIKDNIRSFDGDPNSVTLFGHGHGAALVNFLLLSHVVSEDTNLKFHRAIIQSGSALSTWATSFDPVACVQKLAENVNCSEHMYKSYDLIKCFKNKTADYLIENAPLPPKYFSCFAPTLDNATFFSENSIEKLIAKRSGLFSKISVMFGVTKNEAYSYLKQKELENGISEFRKSQILRTYVQNIYKYHRQKIFEILHHHYSNWDRIEDDKTRRDDIIELLSDGQYAAPLIQMAKKHSTFSDTYLYSFGFSAKSEVFPHLLGAIYEDELPYIFGAPLVDGVSPFPSKYTKYQTTLSAFMMRMWTNFAKSGNPNFPMKSSVFEGSGYSGIHWSQYEEDRQLFLQIGKRTLLRDHYRGKQIALWTDLVPKINTLDHELVPKSVTEEHNLQDPRNMSSYDDPNRLLSHFRGIDPSFVIEPPITPLNNGNKSPNNIESKNELTQRIRYLKDTRDEELHDSSTAARPVSSSIDSVVKSSVPLSITVAVGCTLLFFNILIFAGVVYQRGRIKNIKRKRSRQTIDDIKMSHQNDTKMLGTVFQEKINLVYNIDKQNVPTFPRNIREEIRHNQAVS